MPNPTPGRRQRAQGRALHPRHGQLRRPAHASQVRPSPPHTKQGYLAHKQPSVPRTLPRAWLIRKRPPLEPYSRPMPRVYCCRGGGALSNEGGTLVPPVGGAFASVRFILDMASYIVPRMPLKLAPTAHTHTPEPGTRITLKFVPTPPKRQKENLH